MYKLIWPDAVRITYVLSALNAILSVIYEIDTPLAAAYDIENVFPLLLQ